MSDTVISANGLGKRYTIGARGAAYKTLRESLTQGLQSRFGLLQSRRDQPIKETEFWALKDLTFEVMRGDVVGIVGRNGAGKSTLLRILSRITEPTEGSVEIVGRVGSLLEVGTGFHPELTGRENVYLNGAILGMKRSEISAKFDQIVDFAEVEKFLDTPVKFYSSGMYMRLAFAVAAHLEPDILVVDEVLAVGDAAFQKKCLGKMGEVARGGRTVLFVSHNMGPVKTLCTTGLLLQGGRGIFFGSAIETIGRYLATLSAAKDNTEILPGRRTVNSPVRIARVVLIGSDGAPTTEVPFGKDLKIRLTVELAEPVGKFRVGIGVGTVDGTRLFTTHSSTIDSARRTDSPLTMQCRVIGGCLRPGTFNLAVGCHSIETGRTLDHVPDVVQFTVLDIAAEDGADPDRHDYGFVNAPAVWEGDLG